MLAAVYWQYSQALPWAIGLLIVAALMLMWLYPPQLRHAPARWRWAMPALRLLAVGAIAVSILRPVVSRPRTGAERGPVLWLFDTSRSMGVIDSGRPVGQWVAIAAAMGRLPGQPRDANTQAVQADCDCLSMLADDVERARSELDYARLSDRAVDAAQARLDQSIIDLQTTARSAITKAAILIRRGALEKTLAYLVNVPVGTDQQAWLDRIRDKARAAASEAEQVRVSNDALLYNADQSVRETCAPIQAMNRLLLCETIALDDEDGLISRVGADVPAKLFGIGDHVTPIDSSAGRAASRTSLLQADGNTSNLSAGIRSALSAQGNSPVRAVVLISDGRQIEPDLSAGQAFAAPVFTVCAGGRSVLNDVSIVEATAPSSAFVGETVTIHVEVRGTGMNGRSTDVTLGDGQDHQTHHVVFTDDHPVPIDFEWTPAIGGAVQLTVHANELSGEVSIENNHVTRWVKVFDHKTKVAIVAKTSTQDMELARQALASAAWAEQIDPAHLSPEAIAQLDVLLLNDLRSESFDSLQWAAIRKLVSERGGSVILIPGDGGSLSNAVPADFLPSVGTTATPWRIWPGDRPGFNLGPAPGVRGLDPIREGDSEWNWESLSPISRYLPITPLKADVRALLVETESGTPVLTEQRMGRGRVLCFGENETWRWASGGNDSARFWRQLFRYAAGESYESQSHGMALGADAIATIPGRPVHLRAKIFAGPDDPRTMSVQIKRDGAPVIRRVLDAKGAGIFETTLSNLREGDYEIEADAGAGLGHPQIPLHIHPSFEAEMTDLSADEVWLRRLAEQSGGQFYRLDQVDLLAKRLRELPVDPNHPIELSLWDAPYVYLFVVGCLATEWGLRKRFGLA